MQREEEQCADRAEGDRTRDTEHATGEQVPGVGKGGDRLRGPSDGRSTAGSLCVVHAAVTDRDGGAEFGVTGTGDRWGGARVVRPGSDDQAAAAELGSIERGETAAEWGVPALSLDEEWARRGGGSVGLLKLDLEGHEMASFQLPADSWLPVPWTLVWFVNV